MRIAFLLLLIPSLAKAQYWDVKPSTAVATATATLSGFFCVQPSSTNHTCNVYVNGTNGGISGSSIAITGTGNFGGLNIAGNQVSTNPVSVWNLNGSDISNNNSGTVNVLTSLTATAVRGNPTISSATVSLLNQSGNSSVSIGTTSAGIVYNNNLYVGNGMSNSNGTSGAVFLTGIQTTNNGVLGGVEFTNSGSRQASIVAYNNGGATTTGLQINTSNAGSENVTPVTVTGAGNVGIGTTNPGAKLQVDGPDASSTTIRIVDHEFPTFYWDILRNNSNRGELLFKSIASGVPTTILNLDPDGSIYLGTSTTPVTGAWTAWTPIVTGCSGAATITYANYKKIDKSFLFSFDLQCTSNSSNFQVTFPFRIGAGSANFNESCRIEDNGTFPAGFGLLESDGSGASTATVYKDASGAGFTGSGTKRAQCSGLFEVQ